MSVVAQGKRTKSVERTGIVRSDSNWMSTYVFSRDHKIIGLQFLCSSLLWFVVGAMLALAIRWQLAWPWSNMPILGRMFFAAEGGQISPEFYNVLITMHATIMVFFVIIPILVGAFGNYLLPLMIGAEGMAVPTLNMLSYWIMWPAFVCVFLSFVAPGNGATAAWTFWPPPSLVAENLQGSGAAQTLWVLGITCVGMSLWLAAISFIATIVQMRAQGMTMFRLPLTVWSLFVVSIVHAIAVPVLTAIGIMHICDFLVGTGFFAGLAADDVGLDGALGQSGLWHSQFWFYTRPAVCLMVLPAMGMISDMLSCFARKPLFDYRTMVYSFCGIAGLGAAAWAHSIVVSGISPWLDMTFSVCALLLALPLSLTLFNWLCTLWGGKIEFTTPMLFTLASISMFIIGGLSGIFVAVTPVNSHDTYINVAHFHYVLLGGALAALGAIYFWFPKMFGRMLNETWGKVHFLLTFVLVNVTFFSMHVLGTAAFPRRAADPYQYDAFRNLQPMNGLMTVCAIGMIAVQIIFAANLIHSMFYGRVVGRNPWLANSLEWMALSPPGHRNFDFRPTVYRGPYEYGSPDVDSPNYPQTQLPPESL